MTARAAGAVWERRAGNRGPPFCGLVTPRLYNGILAINPLTVRNRREGGVPLAAATREFDP